MKKTFATEAAYFLGLLILAAGTSLMEKADLGMSMVVAPAYLLHRKLQFLSFGTAEYCLQLVLIVLLSAVLRRFRLGYLFSFVTALIYGFILDGCMAAASHLPADPLYIRFLCFAAGLVLCAAGVALLFRSYFAPEAYELVVKEISRHFDLPLARCKTVYDIVSLVVSVALSFCFFGFGRFEGVKWGTVLTALVNGRLIGILSELLDRHFVFRDLWPLRCRFE